jgi:hypothetical protein
MAAANPARALARAFEGIGFNGEAAAILTDVNRENITLDNLKDFDAASVKTLCLSLKKPGGMIMQGGRNGVAVPNPGVYVSGNAERNMEAAGYMAAHYDRTQRTLTVPDLTLANIRTYHQHKQAEKAFKEREEVLKLEKPEKIIEFIDDWPDYLALVNGQNGCPLSYVIREAVAVPNEAIDPPFGDPASVYSSMRNELIARASHNSTFFRVDNARVYELLNEAVSSHPDVKTWIKPYASAKNGRGAWEAFILHYRGSSARQAIEEKAEKQLNTLIYRGEKHRYTFETHVSKHRNAHIEIEKATGTALPETNKVRKLLNSIQSPTLEVPKSTIQATDNLKESFDRCVNFLRAFISATEIADTRNISNLNAKNKRNRGDKGGKKGKRPRKERGNRGDSGKDDTWVKKGEWEKLTEDQREKVIKARLKRKLAAVKTPKKDRDDDRPERDQITQSQKKSKKHKKRPKDDSSGDES